MNIRKFILILALCAGIIISQSGCGSEEPVSENLYCLNTICTITVHGMDAEEATEAIDAAFVRCQEYEKLLSKTVKGSDIYRLNHAGGKAVRVNAETRGLIETGIQYGKLSGGMFDITIGAVSDLWDFTGENPRVPEEKKLAAAVKTVDYRQISIDGDTVRLRDPQARIDLGGMAKGYIADKAAETLRENGVEQAVISLGGNIVTIGSKAKDTPWKIGLERPYSDRMEILGTVAMNSGTIVTSGVYERCFWQGDTLYHHVLDPHTGYPVKTKLEAVTVKGPAGQSMYCDALSTICLMLGEEKSRQLLDGLDDTGAIQAAFIDAADKVTVFGGMKIKAAK